MSASHASLESVILMQLVAALRNYESDVAEVTACQVAPEAYGRVRLRLDEMRNYASSLPKLSVPWVELLISHFELTHGLWRVQQSAVDEGALQAAREHHDRAVRRLHEQCLRMLQEKEPDAGVAAAGRVS
jgi:hypothetical protein